MRCTHRLGFLVALALLAAPAIAAPPKPPAAYSAELAAGRKLTAAGQHSEAIAALDRALAVVPGDARALAARGYARLLSVGDGALGQDQLAALDLAERDLKAALEASAGPDNEKLHKAIQHNLGLVTKRRGVAPAVEGACTVTFERLPPGERLATWRQVGAHLHAKAEITWDSSDMATEDAARARLCREQFRGGDPCSTTKPSAAVLYDGDYMVLALYAPNAKGVLTHVLLTSSREYQCAPEGSVSVTPLGDLVRVEAYLTAPRIHGEDSEGNPCTVDVDDECRPSCSEGSDTESRDLLVNPTTGAIVRVVSRQKAPSVRATGTRVEAPGCAAIDVR